VRGALLAALALAGCATTGGQELPSVPQGARYVALGSSFAAGAAIGPTKPGTPERCGRTVNNYASLLAARLRLELVDQSCGGATTAHLLGPWNELPPQIEAINAATRLVTVTIGGNDLNYVGFLFMAGCDPATGLVVQERTFPCSPPRAPSPAEVASAEAGLRNLARQVRQRAPQARLVYVQYVTLVPQRPCPAANLSAGNAKSGREIGWRLAEITARVAREEGAEVLPADRLSQGHTPCDAQPWANGMAPGFDLTRGAPWHPNAAGHAAIAAQLERMLSDR
jgi:lysophospholipase L1-like esterase